MKRQREEDPSKSLITDEMLRETSYVLENGLRKVQPYWHNFTLNVKQRMLGKTLLDAMGQEFSTNTEAYYRSAIGDGRIAVNGATVDVSHVLKGSDRITHRVHRHEPPVSAEAPVIVGETSDFVAVHKPASIPVHPTGRYRHQSLLFILAHEFQRPRLLPAHRLDRLTSGCIIFGTSSEAAARMSALVRDDGAVHKEYVALVHGLFPASQEPVVVDRPIRVFDDDSGVCVVDDKAGKPAVSAFQLQWHDEQRNVSVVKCFPRTGRTHQLRVHLQSLGHPIVGDPLYTAAGDAGRRVVDSDGRTRRDYDEGAAQYSDAKCAECGVALFADPPDASLRLHLHALRYQCREFDFSTPLPAWATQHQ